MHRSITLSANEGRPAVEMRYDPSIVQVTPATMYAGKPALAFELMGRRIATVPLDSLDKEFAYDYERVPTAISRNGLTINYFPWGGRISPYNSPLQIIW